MIAQKASGGPAWAIAGAVAFGFALWVAYAVDPAYMGQVRIAFDRLTLWGQLLVGSAAGLALVVGGLMYLLGKHDHGHRHVIGALLAVAVIGVGPAGLHWFGLLVTHIVGQITASGAP